jgi:AraC-like DNA-binding protein
MHDKNHIFNFNNINISEHKVFEINEFSEVVLLEQNSGDGVCMSSLIPGKVHFLFLLDGSMKLTFMPSQYTLPLEAGNYYFLYNPIDPNSFQIIMTANSRVLLLQMNADHMHSLFLDDDSELSFLHGDNGNRKYYKMLAIEPSLFIPLNQMFSNDMAGNTQHLYLKSKVLEILSICFGKKENPDEEACPFLKDTENVDKIRNAKKILVDRMQAPPNIKELCREVGLNEYTLKTGFKNVYGLPVMNWLSNHKLEIARKQLMHNDSKVNEIADELGYNSPSHFIDAFKKKFGVTPKKYQQSAG